MGFLDSCLAVADVSQGRVGKEPAHDARRALQPGERDAGEQREVIGAFCCGAAEVVVLDVLPYPFIRVEVRGVGRQEEQGELSQQLVCWSRAIRARSGPL